VSLPTILMPTAAGAMMELSTAKVVREPCSDGKFFDRLHKLLLIWLHCQSLLASRILAEGP
jgi:hypothetical protein